MNDEPMTIRDMFALHALPGVMRSMDENGGHGFATQGTARQIHRRTALMAYLIADNMMEARKINPARMVVALKRVNEDIGSYDEEDEQ